MSRNVFFSIFLSKPTKKTNVDKKEGIHHFQKKEKVQPFNTLAEVPSLF